MVVADWTLRRTWTRHLSTRNEGHVKPVFTGEWHRLVEEKKLKVDDLFIFKKHENRGFSFEVWERHMKFYGVSLGSSALSLGLAG